MKESGVSVSIQEYEKLLISIKKELPDSEIYVESILPVNSQMNDNNNEQISEANIEIELLCNKMGITYIDLFSLYNKSAEGLPKEWTKDGIHLNEEVYQYWYTCIGKYIYND